MRDLHKNHKLIAKIFCLGVVILFICINGCYQSDIVRTQTSLPISTRLSTVYDSVQHGTPASTITRTSIPSTQLPTNNDLETAPVKPTSDPFTQEENEFILVRRLENNSEYFAITNDLKWVAISDNEKISVYSVDTNDLVFEFFKPSAGIISGGPLVFSPIEDFLAAQINVEGSNGSASDIIVWDWRKKEIIYQVTHLPWPILTIKVSSDGKFLGAVNPPETGQVKVWDLESGDLKGVIDVTAMDLAFDPAGNVLAIAGVIEPGVTGSMITFWDIDDCKIACKVKDEIFPVHNDQWNVASNISYSLDGSMLAAIINGKLKIWDLGNDVEIEWTKMLQIDNFIQIEFTADGNVLALDSKGLISFLETKTGKLLGKLNIKPNGSISEEYTKYSMRVGMTGKVLVTGGNSSPIEIWSLPLLP